MAIIKDYMEKHGITQYALAESNGLKVGSIQRQIKADSDAVTTRTYKLLAAVMGKTPGQVFDEVYELAGGMNDYGSEMGMYHHAVMRVRSDGTATIVDDSDTVGAPWTVHQLITQLGLASPREGETLIFEGGPNTSDWLVVEAGIDKNTYRFTGRSNKVFRSTWRRLFADSLPNFHEISDILK